MLDRPVLLDEVLLGHHHRLGRRDLLAVVAEDVQRGRGDRVTAAQHEVVEHAARRRTLAVPAVDAPAAEVVDQAAVPAAPAARERVVQQRDLVDAAVDRAGLPSDDVRHRAPLRRGRACEVGGIVARARRPSRELARGRAVQVVDARGDRAVLVERRPKARALGLAHEWLLVRAGEHRPGDRVVLQGQTGGQAARRGGQGVRADVESAHEPRHAPPARREGGGHIAAVHPHDDARRRRSTDPDQDVAAGHHVRAGRQRLHAQRGVRGRGNRGQQQHNTNERAHLRPLPADGRTPAEVVSAAGAS